MTSNKNKSEIINRLFIILQKMGFIYHIHVEIEEDEEDKLILCKMKQIWFAYKK